MCNGSGLLRANANVAILENAYLVDTSKCKPHCSPNRLPNLVAAHCTSLSTDTPIHTHIIYTSRDQHGLRSFSFLTSFVSLRGFHINRRTSLDILINCSIILLSHNRKAIDIQLRIARERYDANKSEDLIYYPSDRGYILRYRERSRQLSPWATAKASAFRAILSPVLRFSRPFFPR